MDTVFFAAKLSTFPIPAELEWDIVRMRLVSETGWTLDYVDSLSDHDVQMYLAYQTGIAAAQRSQK